MWRFRESVPDYYSILGVLRDATPDEITAAYYLLASKLHPDLLAAEADESETADFRRINEAYQVLSDPRQRRKYDQGRRQGTGRRRVWPNATPRSDDCQTLAEAGDARRRRSPGAATTHISAQLPITPEEIRYGTMCRVTLTWLETCPACRGTGRMSAAMCPVCRGQGARARREAVDVAIPAGMRPGSTIRINGKGNRSEAARKRGDLILRLVVKPCW